MFSFTDFKLKYGIKNSDRDTEYVKTLVGVIKELYSVFGIALTKDTETQSDTLIVQHDTEQELTYKNILTATIAGATEGTDYTLDKVNGLITFLSTGSITNGSNVTIDYTYYIFINESNEVTYEIYPKTNKLKYLVDIKPYTITEASYLGTTLVEDTSYYSYNSYFELVTPPSNVRKPIQLKMEIGYETIPEDLKQAFYDLVKLRIDRLDAKADMISRVQDNKGSEVTYKPDSIPKHIKEIFYAYSGRSLVS